MTWSTRRGFSSGALHVHDTSTRVRVRARVRVSVYIARARGDHTISYLETRA